MNSRGFTLMELLLVLAVGSMIVSLSGPLYSTVVPGARTKAEAHDLMVALRDTANKAVSTGRETRVSFAPAVSQYVAGEAQPVTLSAATQLAAQPSFDSVGKPAGTGDATVTIRFFPDGSSSGATIRIGNANRDYLIGVDWLTGRVELLEHVR